MKQFETTHPISGLCIYVQVDENNLVQKACYDNSEPLNLYAEDMRATLQAEADAYYGTDSTMKQFETTHPVTSEDVRVVVDEDFHVTEAYFDDGEEVDLHQEGVRDALQVEANRYFELS